MLIRALIVLLIVLNLGVAAWWLAADLAPRTTAAAVQPADVPRLLLLKEQPPMSAVVQRPAQPAAAGTLVADASPPRCFSLGPFDTEATARAALERVRSMVSLGRTREVPASGASAYNVFLPPSPDRAQAQAAAARIGAAGFDDFLVVGSGDLVNAVALGRYGSLQTAQRRQTDLQAAGFPAQVSAVGARTPAQWWLDARAVADFTAQQAQGLVRSTLANELDCSLLL